MAYKVNYRGLDVECASLADLDALADHASGNGQTTKQSKSKVAAKKALTGEPVADFVSLLNKPQLKIIKLLLPSSRALTDTEIRGELKFATNNQLAGYLAGITRAAKKSKCAKDAVLVKTTLSSKPGARAYSYDIPAEFKRKLRVVMK